MLCVRIRAGEGKQHILFNIFFEWYLLRYLKNKIAAGSASRGGVSKKMKRRLIEIGRVRVGAGGFQGYW